MKVKCECKKEVELKDTTSLAGFSKTIMRELSAVCSDCEMLLSYRAYAIEDEELEDVKGLLK